MFTINDSIQNMKAAMRSNASLLGSYYAQLYNGEPFFEVFPASIAPFNFAGTSKFVIDRNKFEVYTGYTFSNGHPLSADQSISSIKVNPEFIELDTKLVSISGCMFTSGGTYTSPNDTRTDTGIVLNSNSKILFDNSGYLRQLIGLNSITSPNRLIDIGQTGTALIDGVRLLPGNGGYVALHSGSSQGGETVRVQNGSVGIGTTSIDADAALQINSTTKGFLPPRMTSTQRDNIASPVPAGLMIYNTDTNKLNFYNGTGWRVVSDTAA